MPLIIDKIGIYNMKDRERVEGFNIVRAFAFLGVFLQHTGIVPATGAYGVSLFFVMSGFLMTYNYSGKKSNEKVSVKSSIMFSIRKISKLYTLQIFTMIAMLPFLAYNCFFQNRYQFVALLPGF